MINDVYVSPHFDDAVISCGGAIARAAEEGHDVLVVTIFGGEVPPRFIAGELVRRLHAAWGHPADPVGQRRREDRDALALVGAGGRHLDHPDAAYRVGPDGAVRRAAELYRDLDAQDVALVHAVARDLARIIPADVTLHAPIAVGSHVDHRIARLAAEVVATKLDIDLLSYEDLPYAARVGAAAVAPLVDGRAPIVHSLTTGQLDRKLAAAAAYGSQVRMLWGSANAMRRELRWYARGLVESGYAEREWVAVRDRS